MPPTTEMPQQPFETANRNANIPTNAITIPLWPSAAAPHRVSDFTLQRDSPSSAEFKARCGLGVSGGGGGSTLHGGMGMSLTAQAAMDVLGGGRVERVKVDYRGGVPLPGLVHGRVNVVEKEGQKTAESNIVDLGTGKPLVQCVASFAALSSGPAVVRPRRSELPSKLKELMAKYPTVNHAYNESPHVVSNMTAPSSSYRFEHPTGIAFIWKTIYGPGQLERSYEVMTPEFGEVWYELVNKDGCLSGKDGALHPGVLFGITDFSMSSFTRSAAGGVSVTASLTMEFTPAAATFTSGWLQILHKCTKKEGKKVFLESTVRDGEDGEVLGTLSGLWIITAPVPKI